MSIPRRLDAACRLNLDFRGNLTVGGTVRKVIRISFLIFFGPVPDGCDVSRRTRDLRVVLGLATPIEFELELQFEVEVVIEVAIELEL